MGHIASLAGIPRSDTASCFLSPTKYIVIPIQLMRLTRANDETEYFTKPVLTKFAISRKKCVKLWREESFLPLSD